MLGKIRESEDITKEFKKEFNSYQDSLIYTKSCANDLKDEEVAITREYRKYVLEE